MGFRSIVVTTLRSALLLMMLASTAVARDYRPVIFIPGLMGSTLVNKQGEQVWGGYGDVLGRFEQIAFPPDPSTDTINANGILENFDIAFGFFAVKAYGPMTDFLRSNLGNRLQVFSYDWRQSNFASACDLVQYIDKRPELAAAAKADPGITLVTHSMGGIVGRIFMSYRASAGTAPSASNPCPHQYNVGLFLPIAAPFNGAGHALKTLTDDVGFKWKVIRLDKDAILSVFFTIPSVYELLPRYHNCCRSTSGGKLALVDLFDVENWRAFHWIPAHLRNFPNSKRIAFVTDRLKAAQRLHAIVETPLPSQTRFISIWGYNQSTSTVVTVHGNGPQKASQDWSEAADGDDTVPELSASKCLPNETQGPDRKPCSTIADLTPQDRRMWRFPNTHLGLMADERVQKTVLWALNRYGSITAGPRSLEEDTVPDDIAPFVISSANARSLEDEGLASAAFVNPPESVKGGMTQTMLVAVKDATGQPLPLSAASTVSASVRTASGLLIPATVAMTSKPGHVGITFQAPKGPDALTIEVRLPKTQDVEPRTETLVLVEP